MTNWDGAFLNLALPSAPFGNTVIDRGAHSHHGTFDFIEFDCPPGLTFQHTETFSDGVANLFTGDRTGTWSISSGRYVTTPVAGGMNLNLMDLGLNSNQSMSVLELSTRIKVQGQGGFIFDYYSPDYYRFVEIDAVADKVRIGHYSAAEGWVVDASVSRSISTSYEYSLALELQGPLVKVYLNGDDVLGHAYDQVAMHGQVGLYAKDGTGSFDYVTVRSNDTAFRAAADYLQADVAAPLSDGTVTLTQEQLSSLTAAAVDAWKRTLAPGDERLALLDGIRFSIADLPELALAETQAGGNILVDIDAAGHGWFVDRTPGDDREFRNEGGVLIARGGAAAGNMDLYSVLQHEIGHTLGFEHSDGGLMADTLAAGLRTATPSMPQPVAPPLPWVSLSTILAGMDSTASTSNWTAPPVPGLVMPSIDWSSLGTGQKTTGKTAASGSSWQTDFVNHLARNEAERNPNAKMRIQLDVSPEADVELDHPVSVF